MNTMNILKSAAVALLTAGIMSCEKKENVTTLSLNDVKYSLCDGTGASEEIRSSAKEPDEYIKYSSIDNKTLRIEQKLIVNCCCDSISVKISQEKNNIAVDVHDYGDSCKCLCKGYVNYNITDLREKSTYSFTFRRRGDIRYSVDITYTADLNQTINLSESNSF